MRIHKKIKELPWPGEFRAKHCNFRVQLDWPEVNGEKLLVATFVRNESNYYYSNERTFRLVCSKRENRASVLYKGARAGVRRSFAVCLRDLRWYGDDQNAKIEKADKQGLADWLNYDLKKQNSGLLRALDEWVDQANEEEKRMQMDARGELRDEDVSLCPDELPDGLVRYIQQVVLPQDDTLIYKKGNVRGVCYACCQKVRANKVRFRQGTAVDCPNCGTRVYAYLATSDRFRVDYVEDIATIQKGIDGKTVFIRQWHLKRDPTAEWEKPEEFLEEVCRYAIRGKRVAKWQHEAKQNWFGNATRYKLSSWARVDSVSVVYDGQYYFYLPENWHQQFDGTSLQYCNVDEYVIQKKNGYTKCNTIRFLLDWVRYPAIEKFWKAGYKEVVSDRIFGLIKNNQYTVRWNKSTIRDAIQFPMRLLKIYSPETWTMSDLTKVTSLWKQVESGQLPEKDLPEMARSMATMDDIRDAVGHASIHRILKYVGRCVEKERENRRIEKERAEKAGHAYWTGRGFESPKTYRDYLADCIKLNLNLDDRSVLFPPDLETAHARTIAQVKHKANELCMEGFLREVKRLSWMEWEKNDLLIRLPVDGDELTAEGAYLHHCVGGYVERMANGKTTILLIRRKEEPDKPFYTLEWLDGQVQQCRTVYNGDYRNDPEVLSFVEEWKKKVALKGKKKKRAIAAA